MSSLLCFVAIISGFVGFVLIVAVPSGGLMGVLLWIFVMLIGIYWELHKMGRSLEGADDKREP